MAEHGFFHPEAGYWQTTGDVSDDLFNQYPEGTIEVELKPGQNFEWLDGAWVAVTPPAPSLGDYEGAIQAHVDAVARARLFRDGVTLASYVASTNVQWAAEAQAFVAWRDQVWTYAYQELDRVQSGARSLPSLADILGELPAILWP